MKYPEQQFEKLCKVLTVLNTHFDLSKINPSALHYTVYQQLAEGQEHNKLVMFDNILTKAHKVTGKSFIPLFDNDTNFLLYPHGCNDNHCETAVKAALKVI